MFSSVIHPDFAPVHRQVVAGLLLGRVRIDRVTGQGRLDLDTLLTTDTIEPLFLGKARVQKRAIPRRRAETEDTNDLQLAQVTVIESLNEIAYPADFMWQSNDIVTILDGGTDQSMNGVRLYVHGWLGSTNGFTRVFSCHGNAKQK